MTRDELENLIYERTRCFVDVPVADCIFDLIAAEREACAKVCEDEQFELAKYIAGRNVLQHFNSGCRSCAAAIRARGEA